MTSEERQLATRYYIECVWQDGMPTVIDEAELIAVSETIGAASFKLKTAWNEFGKAMADALPTWSKE